MEGSLHNVSAAWPIGTGCTTTSPGAFRPTNTTLPQEYRIRMRLLNTLLASLLFTFASAQAPFITTWNTAPPGVSPANSIRIPLNAVHGPQYDYTVDWGDGAVEQFIGGAHPEHAYAAPGIYTVSIIGTFPAIRFIGNSDAPKLLSVEQWGDISWATFNGAFSGCSTLVVNAPDAPDLSAVTVMNHMFSQCVSMDQAIGHWDVSNVTSMESMFMGASNFNQPLNAWNVGNVTSMKRMFNHAESFDQDLNDWDVTSVTDMSFMFWGATEFNGDVSNWQTGSLLDARGMFGNAHAFNSDISAWNVGSVTDMGTMFFNANVFSGDLSGWDVGSVTDMYAMFDRAFAFNSDIGGWDVGNVQNMSYMFNQATAFDQDLNAWNVAQVTTMRNMFEGGTAFNGSIADWELSSLTDIRFMFKDAVNFDQPIGNWNISGVNSMVQVFMGALAFDQDISAWDVSNVTDMSGLFSAASSFSQDLSGWDVGNVTNMTQLFNQASAFDSDLSGWDVGSVTNMAFMFRLADSFTGDISGWNVGNVTNMERMFSQNSTFDQDIGAWDVSNVTNMNSMFYLATGFNGDIGGWDVGSVVDMRYMFNEAASFDRDIGGWDFGNVTQFQLMLNNSGLSVCHYDAVLNGLSQYTLPPQPVSFNANPLQYSPNGSAARQFIMDTFGWNILDGGLTEDESSYVSVSGTVVGNSIEVAASGGGGSYAFSWEGPDGFTASGTTVDAEINGTYTVTVSDGAGCVATASFEVLTVGLDRFSGSGFAVYPNPASDRLFVEVSGNTVFHAELLDLSGRMHGSVVKGAAGDGIDVRQLAAGMYIIRVSDMQGTLLGQAPVVVGH